MKHLISTDDLAMEEIHAIFKLAERLKTEALVIKPPLFAANLFFEPSTRTKTSFIVAEKRLQIEPLDFQPELSSMSKGESLLDTAKTFEAIGAKALVIRHGLDDWPDRIIPELSIPVINGGAGKESHPSQSLLDAYTIYEEFGRIEDLNIVMVGDIKHSRVAHSSLTLLDRLGANLAVSGEPAWMDEASPYPYLSMDEAVQVADVLILLRIQHERHEKVSQELEQYHHAYGLTLAREKRMKASAIIMHPGPVNRGVEIDSSLVDGERSRIFKQMHNGVYIRMAILIKLLHNWGIINEHDLKKC